MSSSSPLSANYASHDELLDEIVEVCHSAAKGNLEPRVLHTSEDPRLAALTESINSLLDSADLYVRESTASLRAASERRYYRRVLERGMSGTFRTGAKLLNLASNDMHEQHQQLDHAESARMDMIRDLQHTLFASSQRISDSIQSISRITKSTHMLALNAKIEAARAGEAGRGFAIVAHEVELVSNRVSAVMEEIDKVFADFNEETHEALQQVVEKKIA